MQEEIQSCPTNSSFPVTESTEPAIFPHLLLQLQVSPPLKLLNQLLIKISAYVISFQKLQEHQIFNRKACTKSSAKAISSLQEEIQSCPTNSSFPVTESTEPAIFPHLLLQLQVSPPLKLLNQFQLCWHMYHSVQYLSLKGQCTSLRELKEQCKCLLQFLHRHNLQ